MSVYQHATFIFGMSDLHIDRYWSNWEKQHDKAIYIQHYTVAHSCNYSCHGNTTIRSSCMVVGIQVGVTDIKMFSGATEMQQSIHFALLSNYIIFHITANNKSIKYYEWVALLLYYLSSMKTASFSVLYYIVMCSLSGFTTFFHIIS
jgi:hypothetical protein